MPNAYDNAPANVRSALSDAARLTGVDENFLKQIAGRESGFNPLAANPKSSAQGLGQFIDTTWDDITRRKGGRYGISPTTSRFDARASALMLGEFVKENRNTLQKNIGRAPTNGELYAAHFLGAGGASQLIQAQQGGYTASVAADLYPEAAAANPSVFTDKKTGRKRTVGEVYANLTKTADGSPLATQVGAMPTIYTPDPVLPKEHPVPFLERLQRGYIAAAEQEQTQVMLYQFAQQAGDEKLAPDPTFKWTDETSKRVTEGLSQDHAEWIAENAHSDAHADALRQRVLHDIENEKTLAEFGFMGNFGLRGAAVLTDVPTWLIGAGAGKLGALGKAGLVASAARGGLIAAAENLPSELIKAQQRPSYGMDDIAFGTATSLAFGAAFGGIFGKSGSDLDEEFAKNAHATARDTLDANGIKLNPTGEQHFDALAGPRVAASGGSAATPLKQEKFLSAGRFDVFARLNARANFDVRDTINKLFVDPVGDGGKTVRGENGSAWDDMNRTHQTVSASVRRPVNDAFNDWANARGLGIAGKIKARTEFNEAVYKAHYEAIAPTDPHILKAVQAYQEGYRNVLAKAKEAGAEWAAKVDPNERYVPMVFDQARVRQFVSQFGEEGVASVISQALRQANPKLVQEVADKVAEKYLRTVQSAVNGTDASMVHVISGQDREGLKNLLIEQGLDADGATTVVDVLRPTAKSGPANFRRKTLMTDAVKFKPTAGIHARGAAQEFPEGFSVRDLTIQDSEAVFERYTRQMAGQIAMVKAGFQTRGAYISHVNDITMGKVGSHAEYGPDVAASDQKAFDYLGKTIYGIPVRDMSTTAAKVESILGSWNFARFMGQSGIAQLGDVPKLMLRTSMSSAWKTFRLGDIAAVLRKGGGEADQLARELETMTGVGTINARGRMIMAYEDIDEFAPPSTSTQALDRAVAISKTAANVTSMVSGMVPVTDFLGRWATRSSMQHLADVVRGVKKSPTNVLNDMGLGPDQLARFKKLVDKMEVKPNGVVSKMNLEQLRKIDPEGVEMLGDWLSRSARNIVLEPNPAMLPQWMGDSSFRLLMQFRSFSMASHAATTLHNLKMGPAYAAQSMIVTGAWASLIYVGQTYMRSVGQPDQQAYLEKNLDPVKIISGGFSKSSDSGIMPMVIDTIMSPVYAGTGMESPFSGARTTGLGAGIQGTPVVSLANDLWMAPNAAIEDTFREDKHMTQADAKRWTRMLPFNNTYLVSNAMSAFTGLFPESD